MSTNYKLKKYLNKLENTSSAEKMDMYYKKIKQYKTMQSGGWKWRDDLQKKVEELDKVKDVQIQIQKITEGGLQEIDKIKTQVKEFSDEHRNVGVALEDALRYLKEITDKIKTEGIDFKILDPILETLTGIDFASYPAYDPTEVWNLIGEGFEKDDIARVYSVKKDERDSVIQSIREKIKKAQPEQSTQ